MKKIICTILSLILAMSLSMPVMAAEEIKPIVSVYKYDDSTGKYDIATSQATTGDLLLVRVAFNREVTSLASLKVTLSFSKDKISYVKGTFTPELVAGDTQVGSPVFTNKENRVVAFFGKNMMTSGDEIATNVTNIASFIFCCEGAEGEVEFQATISNALDKNYQDVALSEKTGKAMVTLKNWTLSNAQKEIFKALETIVYAPGTAEDSKATIDKADKIYDGLTAAEKVRFKSQYPSLFENYRTAWTRYYDASLEASQAAIKAEVERFVQENREALSIESPEEVNDSNYQKVLDAIDTYGKLTGQAQVKALDYKAKLDKLQDAAQKIADQIAADSDAETYFINPYKNVLWNLKDADINVETYADLMLVVAEAQAEYDNLAHSKLSSDMKNKVAKYYNRLQEIAKQVTEIAKQVGEDETVQKEIEAFTEKWHVVTRLTALTVGVDDKTAIEMMLEDFDKLSDIAKERMASRKTMAEQLLTMIEGLDDIQNSVGGNSGIAVVPQGGTTQEVIKEVQVPVDKLVTQTLSNVQFRNVPTIVYVMILLMGVAMLSMGVPIGLYLIYLKKKRMKGEMMHEKIKS